MADPLLFEARNIAFHPLFADALAGEFTAGCDPKQGQHTVGRLAFAAYQKGKQSPYPNDPEDIQYDACEYTPSWAKDFVVTTLKTANRYNLPGFTPSIRTVSVLNVKTDANIDFDFRGIDTGEDLTLDLTISNPAAVSDRTYALELGEPIVIARSAVALAAEDMFRA